MKLFESRLGKPVIAPLRGKLDDHLTEGAGKTAGPASR